MKKWIFLSMLGFSLIGYSQDKNLHISSHDDVKQKTCFCDKKCFTYCKFRGKVVKGCSIISKTTISFSINCSCRALKEKEVLPEFYRSPKSCLIKPAQAAY